MIITSGCNQNNDLPPNVPKLYPTTITVIQDGQGLGKASVTLMPLRGSGNTWYAGAQTNAQGVAVMMTQGQYNGTVPGKYKILVRKQETTPSTIVLPDPGKDSAGYAKALELRNKEVRESFNLIDLKYSSVDSTPEEIEIIADKNEKTVDVGKSVKIKIPVKNK
jgi:hypothetical protein